MALFCIADPHLSLGCDKPMDIFKGWENYLPKLETNWRAQVGKQDCVVLAGDISWAMRLEDCLEDFRFLHDLPGRKILLKGNHDLWWETRSKMEAFLEKHRLNSLSFLHNNCFFEAGIALCGSRGWMCEKEQGHDAKMIQREALRLEASLSAADAQGGNAEKVVFLHYPPFYNGQASQALVEVMQLHGVRRCFYGHLHAATIQRATQGIIDGIEYRLISADSLQFRLLAVENHCFG